MKRNMEKARAFERKRRSGLRPGPGPRRKKPIARVNRKRRATRFERAFHSPGFVAWMKEQDCAVPGCERTDIECAHVDRPRSRGGTWQEIAPLCRPHHREQEKRTARFNRKYGIRLELVAAGYAQRWMAFVK
jgi:hypothetical protein